MTRKIYFSILLSLFFLHANAQWTSDTLQNTLVRDSVGTNETTPLSATLSNGSTYISWFESYNGNYQLRMQLLDVNGNKLWSDEGLIVDSNPQSSALYRYDLKVDHSDNAILAFQDMRTGSLNIVAYMIDQNGNPVWGNAGISLVEDVPTQGLSPVIGVTAANDIIIAWNASASPAKWVSYQKISQAGTLVWGTVPKRIIDSTNVKKYSRPSIVPAGANDFVMLYVQETGSFPFTNAMFAQRYDVDGESVWSNSVQVSSKTIAFFFFPEIISDQNGGFYLGFNTSNPVNASLNDVYVQHLDSSGNLWSVTGTEAANSTTTHKTTPSLKFISSRSEVWVLLKVQDSGQGMSGIFVQKFDLTGTVLLDPNAVEVLPVNTVYYEPYDFENTDTGMIIVYTTGTGLVQFLNAEKIDYTGVSLWSPATISVSAVASEKFKTTVGTFHNNQLVVVWEDWRIDDGVYAQNIVNDGTIGPLAVLPITSSSAENFILFPNPSYQLPVLRFNVSNAGKATLLITDAYGNCIMNKAISLNSYVQQIDLSKLVSSNLASGVYFVELMTNDKRDARKWIKE